MVEWVSKTQVSGTQVSGTQYKYVGKWIEGMLYNACHHCLPNFAIFDDLSKRITMKVQRNETWKNPQL